MSDCTARDCARPTQTMLCRGCLAQLVDALRELAYGTVQRRDHAERPSDQRRRRGLLADLQDTITRTDHLGPTGAGKIRGKGSVTGIEYHVAASHLADAARNTVSTWARAVHDANPHLHLPRTHVAACAWMAGLARVLAVHPAAGELHDDITRLADRVRRMIDLAPDLTYLGVCSGPLEDGGECDWDLYAEQGDSVIQCARCGDSHEVSYRKERMIKAMEDQLLPATDLRSVLGRYMPRGAPSVNTIRSWAHRRRLAQRPPMPGSDSPRYRVGDVLDLIARQERDDHDEEGQAS